jgi:23S rRNA (cytosine1962-C5)-methyltransferase
MSDFLAPEDADKKIPYQAEIFGNRLAKKIRHIRKWARRNSVESFRVFDRDIPEIHLSVDLYRIAVADAPGEDFALMSLFERPSEKPPEEEDAWLSAMKDTVSRCLGIPLSRVLCVTRKRQRGKNQYEKTGAPGVAGIIREAGARFSVFPGKYVDTGFFLEHRKLRARVRDESRGRRVLNLFSYTCAFSVFAALGGARRVDSVDLSNTYLGIGKDNFLLNGLDPERHGFYRSDTVDFLSDAGEQNREWDLIILDPPAFSNSKMSRNTLDTKRDWPILVNLCVDSLAKEGALYFCVHTRGFRFDESALTPRTKRGYAVSAREEKALTSEDFARSKQPYRVWKITVS